jgi:lysophospholipase L1-like esterase
VISQNNAWSTRRARPAIVIGVAIAIAAVGGVAVAIGGEPTTTNSVSRSTNPAAKPAPQYSPLFQPAHKMLLEKARAGQDGQIDVYFLGDSITRRWQGTDYPEHKKNWDANFFGWNAANFGWGADSTQNVLWRLEHGELDGIHPKIVVLMIGTNNVSGHLPNGPNDEAVDDIADGIKAIVDSIRQKAPEAKIVLMGITPRVDKGRPALMPGIDRINARLSTFADGDTIVYLNVNDQLTDPQGKLLPGVTEDGLHLSIAGYQIWADALKPIFTERLGPPATIDKAPPASGVPEVE